jgi:triphosphoribosyl-dephospho-CoA synthase
MADSLSPGTFAQVACLLEATARKPGNVHRFKDFSDSHYLDFALSALTIGAALDRAIERGVGAAVLDAVKATRRFVATNTNLGMILLIAPMAAVPEGLRLSEGIHRVLESLTVVDARMAFEAIRHANPGGLGTVETEDVSNEPTVTLRDAMRLAAGRDSVARQYVNGFEDVLGSLVPCLASSLVSGHSLETAIIATFLSTLSSIPDTLIARKRGRDEAVEASLRASEVLASGWPDREEGLRSCEAFDRWLRAEGHTRNPGTTADLVAAAIFAALREGIITLPIGKARLIGSPESE